MADSEEIRAINRRIDSIIRTTNLAEGSIVLNNGDFATFTITTTSDSGAKVLTQVDLTLYMDNIDGVNEIPFGSSVDAADWQMVGPVSDWGSTDNLNTVTKVYLRNISAGTQTVIIEATSRIIVNSPTTGGEV